MKKLMLVSTALVLAACGSAENEIENDAVGDTSEIQDFSTSENSESGFELNDLMSFTAAVINSSGNEIGTATITDQAMGGVTIELDVTAMPEGSHAIHFHETGRCDTPDFTSAGGHYNPTMVNHGFQSEAPNPHAGDMENFDAPQSGVVKTEIQNDRVSLSERDGLAPLFDQNGTALIIHAGSDDYQTQPTGAAGGRIACALITP